jgi:hypothetical protein
MLRILIGVLLGLFVAEAGYRVNVALKEPRLELAMEDKSHLPPNTVGVFSRPIWQYDDLEGYVYTPDTDTFYAELKNGRVESCGPYRVSKTLLRDNNDDFGDAEIKIAVFGDSFTAFVDERSGTQDTWVTFLERELSARTGKRVRVLNFSRDGNGLLNLFDVAANRASRLRPDLAIFALEAGASMRRRAWRSVLDRDGERRVMTLHHRIEEVNFSDPNDAYDTVLLHPDIGEEWCSKNRNGGTLDGVGAETIEKYRRFRPQHFSAYTLTRSFLWHRIVNGDAFYTGRALRDKNTVLSYETVRNDKLLLRSASILKDASVPYLLVDLPRPDQIRQGKVTHSPAEAEVLRAATDVTGMKSVDLTPYISRDADLDRMTRSADDAHPSKIGMEIYGSAVARFIMENGPPKRRQSMNAN